MLQVGALRGEDSTGVIVGNSKGQVAFRKDAIPGVDFINSRKLQKMFNGKGVEFIVGHNRWATSGAPWDVAGAHPFQHQHITLVHNGTLITQGGLPDGDKFEVDSEAICHSIATIGAIETIKLLDGAFVLVWYDSILKKLFMVRNSQRPLHVFNTHTGIFFCSERLMGEWVLDRNNINVLSSYELPLREMHEFDVTSRNKTRLVTPVEYLKYVPAPYNYNQQGGNFGGKKNQIPGMTIGKSTSSPLQGSDEKKPSSNVIVLPNNSSNSDNCVECAVCDIVFPKNSGIALQGNDGIICKDCEEQYYKVDGTPNYAGLGFPNLATAI